MEEAPSHLSPQFIIIKCGVLAFVFAVFSFACFPLQFLGVFLRPIQLFSSISGWKNRKLFPYAFISKSLNLEPVRGSGGGWVGGWGGRGGNPREMIERSDAGRISHLVCTGINEDLRARPPDLLARARARQDRLPVTLFRAFTVP